jgi:hypothetical protein
MAVGDQYRAITYPSYKNKLAYCQKHDYNFFFYTESLDESRPIPWSKIKIIQEIFQDHHPKWVFWTDADSLIMNPKIKLKDLIDNRYDMIVASDVCGINTGQFFIRNCKWSRNFLKRIYAKEQFINHGWWEQMAIMDELAHNENDMSHVKILPQRVMNSYPPNIDRPWIVDEGTYQKDDFIIHFAGLRGDVLRDMMIKYSSGKE